MCPQTSRQHRKKGIFLLPRASELIQTYFPNKPRRTAGAQRVGCSIPQSRSCGCHAGNKAEQRKTCEGGYSPVSSFLQVPVSVPRGCRSGAEPRMCSASRTPLLGAGLRLIPSALKPCGRRGYRPWFRANAAVRAKMKRKQKNCKQKLSVAS